MTPSQQKRSNNCSSSCAASRSMASYHFIDASSVGTFVSEWGRQCRALSATAVNTPSSSSEKPSSTPPASSSSQHEFDRAFMIKGMEAPGTANFKQPRARMMHPIKDCVFVSAEDLAKRRPNTAPPAESSSSSAPAATTLPLPIICRIYHFPRAELELIRQAASPSATTSPSSAATAATTPSSSPSSDSPSSSSSAISVHDALFAHLMQVICHASNTLSKEPVMICQAFNARRAFKQPYFFGSASFWLTDSKSSTCASVANSLQETAQVVHKLHASQTRDTLLAYNGHLDSFASYADINIVARIMTHDLHVASWRHSGMYGVDIGRGACSYAGPDYFEGSRYLIFMDASGEV